MKQITLAILLLGSISSVSFAQNKWDNSTSNTRNYYSGGDQLVNSGYYEDNTASQQRSKSIAKTSHYIGGDHEIPVENADNNTSSSFQQQRYHYTGGDNMHRSN
ncbi:MAG: hypothetical protein V4525_03655 [Pseudomonadota bacterium]